MNEEALKHAHSLFVKDGYNGSLEDYKSLISSNKEALDYSYDLFVRDGYKNSPSDFENLLGLKKKEASVQGSTPPSQQPQKPSQENGEFKSFSGGYKTEAKDLTSGTRPGTAYRKPVTKKIDVLKDGKKKPPLDWRAMAQEMKQQEVDLAPTPVDVTATAVSKPLEIQRQETQKFNAEQEQKRAEQERLSERMTAADQQTYNRQADYLGIKLQDPENKITPVDMRRMYDDAIKEAQSYIESVPDARNKAGINNVLKQIQALDAEPGQFDDRERLRRKSDLLTKLDQEYKTVENYAMQYWQRTNPGKYELYNNRLNEIRSYSDVPAYDVQGSGNLTSADKKFLDKFRAEAMSLKVNADKYIASKIIDNYDIKGMAKDLSMVDNELESVISEIKSKESAYKLDESKIVSQHRDYNTKVKDLNTALELESGKLMQYIDEDGTLKAGADQQAAQRQADIVRDLSQRAQVLKSQIPNIYDEQGRLIAPASSGPMKALYDKYNSLMEAKSKVYESYNVTPEVIDQLNSSLDGLDMAQKSLAYATKYSENISDKEMAKAMQDQKAREMQEGSAFDKAYWVATDISRGFTNMLAPIVQVPKFASDLMGADQEKGWTDYLYDFSEEVLNTVNDRTRISDEKSIPTWMRVVQDTAEGFGSAVGFGLGGMTTGGIAKGLNMSEKAVKAYQNAGVFSTAFLSSVNANYVEGMENGLSQEEAALASLVKSGMDASLELIVPDYKIFKEANRVNIYSAVKELGLVKGTKAWAPQYMKDLSNSYMGEFIEESAAEVGATGTGMLINLSVDKKVYDEEFKLDELLYTGLTGGNVGALMEGVRFGHKYKHPVIKSMQRDYAEMSPQDREAMLSNISQSDLMAMGELDKEGLTEIADGLNKLPGYSQMTDKDKDDVFSLVLSREQAKKAYKELGLSDTDNAKKEIASYDEQINSLFNRAESERQAVMDSRIKVTTELASSVYPEIAEVEEVMSKGEFADDKKVEAAVTGLNKIIDDIIERDDLSDEEKIQVAQVIEDRKNKIDSYEYRSKSEVSTATQSRPSGVVEKARAANERATKPIAAAASKQNPIPVALDGVKGRVQVSDSTIVDNTGDTIPEGFYVFIPDSQTGRGGRMGAVVIGSVEEIDNSSTFEGVENNPSWSPENNIVANITTPEGQTLSILDDDLSADVGIAQKEAQIGAAPQALFDVVFEEVTTELGITEKPYLKDDTKNQERIPSPERGGEAPIQAEPVQEGSAEEITPSGVVQEQVQVTEPEPITVTTAEPSSPFEYTKSRVIDLKNRAKTDPTLRRALNNLDKAAASFKKTFGSKVPVFVYDNQKQMLEDMEKRSGVKTESANGSILLSDDGEILGIFMNAESQDFTVGSHEFVHGVLSKLFEDNPEMYSQWRDSILRNFKDSDISRLNEWADREYDKDSAPEEFITQLTAELADANKQLQLPSTFLNAIKDLFNSVWELVTGRPLFSERAGDKDVVNFINDMARGLSSGQAINLKSATRIKARKGKPSKTKPRVSKSKVNERAESNMTQISKLNALSSVKGSPESVIAAKQMIDEVLSNNPELEFIMNNFDKIEKALVKEGKLKVNCEL